MIQFLSGWLVGWLVLIAWDQFARAWNRTPPETPNQMRELRWTPVQVDVGDRLLELPEGVTVKTLRQAFRLTILAGENPSVRTLCGADGPFAKQRERSKPYYSDFMEWCWRRHWVRPRGKGDRAGWEWTLSGKYAIRRLIG